MAAQTKWIRREWDEGKLGELSSLKLPKPLLSVLLGRKIDTKDKANRYLYPTLKNMKDPRDLKGVPEAVERIISAIQTSEKIGIFGDYDVDGVTSTTLMWDFLEQVGGDVAATIPNRMLEGYGLSRAGVDRLKGAGCGLIITVDCGITAHEEVQYATSIGLDVIVVDHHTAGNVLPEAVSVINPHRQDCEHGSEYLCAAGVVFNLLVALRREMRERGMFDIEQTEQSPPPMGEGKKITEPNLTSYLDVVALGTVADVVPLVDDNRLFVKFGLDQLRKFSRPGMAALVEVAQLKSKLSASTFGFQLGPRLNAAGRLDDAMAGVRLLRSKSMVDARTLANELDKKNLERRSIEQKILEEAIAQIETSEELQNAKSLVVHSEAWHPGVVGIVASRLVDRFSKPAIVLGEGGKGSGRSIPAFHLHQALTSIDDKLDGFGGHAHAVGVHLGKKSLTEFREALAEYASKVLTDDDMKKVHYYDGDLDPNDVNAQFLEMLEVAKPFGRGNPEPSFRLSNLEFDDLRELKGGHLRGRVLSNKPMKFIAFGMANKIDRFDDKLDVLATPEFNEFNGVRSIQLRIKDVA